MSDVEFGISKDVVCHADTADKCFYSTQFHFLISSFCLCKILKLILLLICEEGSIEFIKALNSIFLRIFMFVGHQIKGFEVVCDNI